MILLKDMIKQPRTRCSIVSRSRWPESLSNLASLVAVIGDEFTRRSLLFEGIPGRAGGVGEDSCS